MNTAQIEHLKAKAEKAAKLAECEQRACLRTLQGMRPSSKKYSQRVKRLWGRTSFAGYCVLEAIQARRTLESAQALAEHGSEPVKPKRRRRHVEV